MTKKDFSKANQMLLEENSEKQEKSVKRFMTQDQFQLLDEHMEHNSGEIITIQDMAMTPAQILDKYSAGITFKVGPPVFSPDPEDLDQEDLGQLKHMELYDLQKRGETLTQQLEQLQTEIREKEKAELERIEKDIQAAKQLQQSKIAEASTENT